MVPGIQTHIVQVLRLPIQLLGTEQRGCRRVSPRIQQCLEAPVIRRPRIVMQGPQRADAGINADLIHRTRYSSMKDAACFTPTRMTLTVLASGTSVSTSCDE